MLYNRAVKVISSAQYYRCNVHSNRKMHNFYIFGMAFGWNKSVQKVLKSAISWSRQHELSSNLKSTSQLTNLLPDQLKVIMFGNHGWLVVGLGTCIRVSPSLGSGNSWVSWMIVVYCKQRNNIIIKVNLLSRFPDRSTQIGGMIDSYLQCKSNMSDESVHLLFSANRFLFHWDTGSSNIQKCNSCHSNSFNRPFLCFTLSNFHVANHVT